MKLSNIINHFKKVCEETGIRPTENCLFENAIKIYISDQINQNKKDNIKSINQSKSLTRDTPKRELATEKQVLALIKMGFKGEIDKVTKEEAWKIINEKKEVKNEQTQRFKEQAEDY